MIKTALIRDKKRKGLTLTELAIVLGCMGLVMGAVWAVVTSVWDNYRQNKMNEDLMTVVQNIRGHFGPKGMITFAPGAGATGDITANLDDDAYRLIPVTMRTNPKVSGTPIQHALAMTVAGSFGVEAIAIGGRNGMAFRVTLRGLSKGNCMKTLMQFPVTMPDLGVIRLEAGGGNYSFDPRSPATLSADLPIQASRANTLCNQNNNTNVVSYDFRLFP